MKKRILMVDDELAFTRGVRQNLEATGAYLVKEVNRGRHALATAREFFPDVILLDVMMPDMDGTDIAADLRDDAVLSRTPVVFLTALASRKEVCAGWSLISGGRTFLPKPVRIAELIQSIEEATTAPALRNAG